MLPASGMHMLIRKRVSILQYERSTVWEEDSIASLELKILYCNKKVKKTCWPWRFKN